MLELFFNQELARSTDSSVYFPDVNYVRRISMENIDKLTNYYRTRIYRVKSNHLLVQILNHLYIPLTIENERILDSILVRGERVGKMFKLTSSFTYGDIFNGVFFGNNVDEIILYDDSYFSIIDMDIHWRNYRPVRVLFHPKSDLDLMLPNGKKSSNEGGTAVISVNIGMLAIQYKKFMEDQLLKNPDQTPLDASYFIHMYVLPNMLPDILDWSIYNRFIYNLDSYKKPDVYFRHPIVINKVDDKVDKIIEKEQKLLLGNGLFIADYFKHLISVSNKNMWYNMLLPDYALTLQSTWAILLSRIRVIADISQLGGPSFIKKNKAEINLLLRDIKYLNVDRVIREKASSSFIDLYNESIEKIKLNM